MFRLYFDKINDNNKQKDISNNNNNNYKESSPRFNTKSSMSPNLSATTIQHLRISSTSPTSHNIYHQDGTNYTQMKLSPAYKKIIQDERKNQNSCSPKFAENKTAPFQANKYDMFKKQFNFDNIRPLEFDSFTQNMGSITESTLEGTLLAQGIPPTKPNTAAKMPSASKFNDGGGIYYNIRNKDIGDVYDIKDIKDPRDIMEINNVLSSRKIDQARDMIKLNNQLLTSCKAGDITTCMDLLDKKRGDMKANINCKGENGWTPLHFACLSGNSKLVNFIIENGANVDCETKLKFTPLIIACQKGFEEIVTFLISSGADINCHDIYYNTPLHYASQYGFIQIVQILLQRPSINLNMKNNENKRAYELTSDKDIKQLFDLFLTEQSLLNSRFMQKVPIHNTKNEQVKQMFDGFQNDFKYNPNNNNNQLYNNTNNMNPTLTQTNNIPTYMTLSSGSTNQFKQISLRNHNLIGTETKSNLLGMNKQNSAPGHVNQNEQPVLVKKIDSAKDTKQKAPNQGLIASGNSGETKLSSSSLNTSNSDSDNSNNMGFLDEEKVGPNSFTIHGMIGKGSFGEVYLVRKKNTNTLYAMKVLQKTKIMKNNLVKYALTERNVLSLTNHPFIVKLNYAFQTPDKLFLILDFCPGGDLGEHLQKERRFSEDRAKIYLAEIILALEDLHRRDIIFRDLKPDNIVLDSEGHALLTDFGLSKEGVLDHSQGAGSFCGSVAYLAPEMLQRAGHGKAVDWYLLGVVFYEMVTGQPPFYATTREKLFENIEKAPLRLPPFLSEPAAGLLKGLLQRNPEKRLGSGKRDAEEIKEHKFFEGINWNDVYSRKLKPPIPEKKFRSRNNIAINVFDTPSTAQTIDKDYFNGWSFVAPEEKNNLLVQGNYPNQ